jgi:hypothetical protein
MSADIISFPKSQKQLEVETMKNFVAKAKTVIARGIAEDMKRYDVPNVLGIPVEEPKTRKQYQDILKQFLEPEDYQDILCGIMDKEHYDGLERPLQKIVDAYYSFVS